MRQPNPPDIGDLVLAAFTLAWREQRLDVADHLLRALEALSAVGAPAAHQARAYRLVARGRATSVSRPS